jgi:hypothetical protein
MFLILEKRLKKNDLAVKKINNILKVIFFEGVDF